MLRPGAFTLFLELHPVRLIALVYGTRPQVIKAALIREALQRRGPCLAVDTGQHYDYELNKLLYEQLGVAPPDVFLDVGSGSHAAQTAAILERAEVLLAERQPRAVAVIGDTNSTLAAALAAAKLRIPVLHVEAGLQARDPLMPEEINRRVVDAIGQVLCTPSTAVTLRLAACRPDAVVAQTGDVAYDVLRRHVARAPASTTVAELPPGTFIYSTIHRAEITAHPGDLRRVLQALGRLGLPVILPLHPRTAGIIRDHDLAANLAPTVRLRGPVGYLESLTLTRDAAMVVTDSGGIQREAYWLGTPCVTLRGETEWHETVALGANRLLDPAGALDALAGWLDDARGQWRAHPWDRGAYGNAQAAHQIAELAERLAS